MQPLTFQELKDQCLKSELKNTRTFGSQKLYETYLQFVPENQKNAILEAQISENQVKYRVFSSGWTFNCFGYNKTLEYLPNVKHCNIWIDDWDMLDVEIQEQINIWIKAIWNRSSLDYCYIINKPNSRSIAHKPHAHVFINFENYKL